jgi:hypothetical protein
MLLVSCMQVDPQKIHRNLRSNHRYYEWLFCSRERIITSRTRKMWGKLHIKIAVYKMGQMVSIQGQVSNSDKGLLWSELGQSPAKPEDAFSHFPTEGTTLLTPPKQPERPNRRDSISERALTLERPLTAELPEPFIQGILLHPHEVAKLFPEAVEAEKARQRRTTRCDIPNPTPNPSP